MDSMKIKFYRTANGYMDRTTFCAICTTFSFHTSNQCEGSLGNPASVPCFRLMGIFPGTTCHLWISFMTITFTSWSFLPIPVTSHSLLIWDLIVFLSQVSGRSTRRLLQHTTQPSLSEQEESETGRTKKKRKTPEASFQRKG